MAEETEVVLRRTANLTEITQEQYAEFYRTKDIYCAAFLISRGFDWNALEEVESTRKISRENGCSFSRKLKLIYFLFPNKSIVERMALNYYNTNRSSLNVNANNFVQAILNVRSIITDPPL